ncbi:SAM-dependent methyltransferase [Nocardiopsis ansamitocini]|uniref:SAM-dependent methyltransferase n=1 Tax=Nocardiopsis ansamitocini TaxID=1670832 RepID=A0A9W6P3I8_9ACTN|nr:class I SAM-dependent methyltransferase [Nocardiopsis ansamitocini]GLU46449.1 SAM-dependent methyltransferase [Nocardiopsis ansamitocini]
MTALPAPRRFSRLDFNSPLSGRRADAIARRLAESSPTTVADLGCGWGELLLRILERTPGATGTGIDTDTELLGRGRANAAARGLSDRVVFSAGPAGFRRAPVDLVVSVGASHAFADDTAPRADSEAALRALRGAVGPGGRVLFGECFWRRPPGTEEIAALWPDFSTDEYTDLPGLVDQAIAAGFRPLWIETADDDEWEHFQSGFLSDREEWLLEHGDRPEADHVRAQTDLLRNAWLRGHRDSLGFAYLTLGVARD